MATLYRGLGLPDINNIGPGFIKNYMLSKNQNLTLTQTQINNLCNNSTYIIRIETRTGNNALSLQFSKNGAANHLTLSILNTTFERDIPATSSLTINYLVDVDATGTATNITFQFVGDSFNLERSFPVNLTFNPEDLEPDNASFNLTTAQKLSIKKIFDTFTTQNFNDKYILSKGTLLYLARRDNYQSNSINIKVNVADKTVVKLVVDALMSNGFSIQNITKANNGEISTIKITDGNARLVIKICYEHDIDNYYYYGHSSDFSQEAKFIFNKDFLDNKKTITFKTINVTIPNDHTGYLVANYGVNWNTPNPTFDRWNDNPTFNTSSSYNGSNLDNSNSSSNDIIN